MHNNKDGFWLCASHWFCTLLGSVRTWAISFLRHLANMSSMVPFWVSTYFGFVPNPGPRIRSHAVRRRLFIFLMTAAHISSNLFSFRNFLSNIHELLPLYIHRQSYLLYITFIQTIYILFIYITIRFTISAGLHGRPAALSPLCPLQYDLRTRSRPGRHRGQATDQVLRVAAQPSGVQVGQGAHHDNTWGR
jgi:hypothetical protein